MIGFMVRIAVDDSGGRMDWTFSQFYIILARTEIFTTYLDSNPSSPQNLDWGEWTLYKDPHSPRVVDAVRCWKYAAKTPSGLTILDDRLFLWQCQTALSDNGLVLLRFSMELSVLDFNIPRMRHHVNKRMGKLTDSSWPLRAGLPSGGGSIRTTPSASTLLHQLPYSDVPINFDRTKIHLATNLLPSTLQGSENDVHISDDSGTLRGADDALCSRVPRTADNPHPTHTLFSLIYPWSSNSQPFDDHPFLSPPELEDRIDHVLLSESHLVFIRVSESDLIPRALLFTFVLLNCFVSLAAR